MLNNGKDKQDTFKLPEANVTDFYNNFWTKYFMEHLATCSNLSKWKIPLPTGTYTLFNCSIPSFTMRIDKPFIVPNNWQRLFLKITKDGEVVEQIAATLFGKLSVKISPDYYYFYNHDYNKFEWL